MTAEPGDKCAAGGAAGESGRRWGWWAFAAFLLLWTVPLLDLAARNAAGRSPSLAAVEAALGRAVADPAGYGRTGGTFTSSAFAGDTAAHHFTAPGRPPVTVRFRRPPLWWRWRAE